jgi:microcystin-dependent protein
MIPRRIRRAIDGFFKDNYGKAAVGPSQAKYRVTRRNVQTNELDERNVMRKALWCVVGILLCAGGAFSQNHVPNLEPAPIPIGTVIAYAGNVGPKGSEARTKLATAGWLVCDGDAILRTKFAKLFDVVGDTHGRGDAVTTFNLPDYRGRFLRGVDAGAGRDPDSQERQPANSGGLPGDNVGSVQEDEFRSHSHTTIQMISDNNIDGVDSTTIHSGEHHNEPRNTGFSGGHETRPRNANVHWLIFAGKP